MAWTRTSQMSVVNLCRGCEQRQEFQRQRYLADSTNIMCEHINIIYIYIYVHFHLLRVAAMEPQFSFYTYFFEDHPNPPLSSFCFWYQNTRAHTDSWHEAVTVFLPTDTAFTKLGLGIASSLHLGQQSDIFTFSLETASFM